MFFHLIMLLVSILSVSKSSAVEVEIQRNAAKQIDCLPPSQIYNVKRIPVGTTSIFASTTFTVKSAKMDEKFYISFSNSTENMDDISLWSKAFRENHNEVRKRLSPFQDVFFKITPVSGNHLALLVLVRDRIFDVRNFVQFVAGILLFVVGKRLSRSFTFYYTFGASLGVLAVFGGVLFILFKLVPYRKSMLGLGMTCTGFLVYLYERLYNNIYSLIVQYPTEVFIVCCVAALLSMAVTYYFGPPTSERTLHLFQWGIQFCALYMIYASSYNKEFSTTAIVMLLLFYFLSQFSILVRIFVYITPRTLRKWYHVGTQPQRKLLTMEEYEEQGRIETEKALRQLADVCNNSPGRYSWKTVSRLRDPQRFANFLNEGEHFTNTELDEYEKFEVTEEDSSCGEADVTDSGVCLQREDREMDEYWMTDDESQHSRASSFSH